jgi:hypothetical protein
MENTLKQLETEGLSIKLTDEKLFINTATSMETFALRSIDGIGVIDLVDQLNAMLNIHKQEKNGRIALIVLGIMIIFIGFFFNSLLDFGMNFLVFVSIIGLSISLIGFYLVQALKKPTLKSAVRIVMSGGNRDFIFDKAHSNSMEVAEFVAKVEDTLTAFHKKA